MAHAEVQAQSKRKIIKVSTRVSARDNNKRQWAEQRAHMADSFEATANIVTPLRANLIEYKDQLNRNNNTSNPPDT